MVRNFQKFVLLGGIFLDSQYAQIERSSKVQVQHAADALQKAVLRGLSEQVAIETKLINVPFIAPFPRGDRKIWFPRVESTIFECIPVIGMGFLNLMILRILDRFRAAYLGIRQVTANSSDCTILVYSAHLPFLLAALAARKMNVRFGICLILPDFPEFMRQGGTLNRLLGGINSWLFFKIVPKIDYFVVLTAAMATRLQIGPEKYTIVEGIYDPKFEAPQQYPPESVGPIFIYTGTLAKIYGILDLLSAFEQLNLPTAQLWICGDGDASDAVEELARRDVRVTYFGRLPRAEALDLQAKAHVMVNPRRPEGEFTRYSFPSKTMEYLASGRPVLMHWLPGIPEEYRPFLITPDTPDAAGLASAMQKLAELPVEELRSIGAAGREFVLLHKNPKAQVGRILAGLFAQQSSSAKEQG